MNERKCRAVVLERSSGRCEHCGKPCKGTMHHRLKRSQGGRWTPANIVHVCGSGTTGSHGWIESHPNDADDIGFHCRPWEDPTTKAVLLHGTRWVRLSDDFPQYHYLDGNERPET